MSDANAERFKPQDVRKDIVLKGSSADDPLIGSFGSRKSVSQGSNVPNKLSQQQNKYQLITDDKKSPQYHAGGLQRTSTGELPRTYTGELQRTRTDELKEEKDPRSSPMPKKVENLLITKIADQEKDIEELKSISTKKILNEEEKRRKDFQRNLNKLALFAYEAEEGIEMLESGESPFLEEVDRMLQEIDSETELLPKEVDQLLQEINSNSKSLPTKVDHLLKEIDGGTGSFFEEEYELLERLKQQKEQRKSMDSGSTMPQERQKKRRVSGYLE